MEDPAQVAAKARSFERKSEDARRTTAPLASLKTGAKGNKS
jgi:hypothetical protein